MSADETPTDPIHETFIDVTRYYTASCSICGVLGQFGYDESAANRCADQHKERHRA